MTLKSHVVTTAQAATILGVSSSTVGRWREQGKLRGFPGRITRASIEEHLGEPVQWPDQGEEAPQEAPRADEEPEDG